MRFKKWVDEQTTTGAIALNLAKGGGQGPGVDVIGADCPDGKKWDKKKGRCVGSRLSEQMRDFDEHIDIAQMLIKKKKKRIKMADVENALTDAFAEGGIRGWDKYDWQEVVDAIFDLGYEVIDIGKRPGQGPKKPGGKFRPIKRRK